MDNSRSRLDDLLTQPDTPIYVSARRSHIIRKLRLLLPLLAVCLLVVVVVFVGPGGNEPPPNIKDVAPNQVGKNELLTPRFESQDGDAQPYSITATRAYQRPDNLNIAILENPVADMLLKDQSWVALKAQIGAFNQSAQFLVLRDGVRLFHDSGYELMTKTLDIFIPQQRAVTNDPVSGHGPLGEITATGLTLDAAAGTLRFHGPAKLTIRGTHMPE